MRKFILSFVAILAFAGIASANGPRAVAFRGGHVGFRAPVANALRIAGNLALRGHGAAFHAAAFHFNHAAAFRNAFVFRQPVVYGAFQAPLAAPVYSPVFNQPVYGAFAPPAYTQGFAAETACGCGGAAFTQGYTQPFAAYSAFSGGYGLGLYGLPLNLGHGHHGHGHGGHRGVAIRVR